MKSTRILLFMSPLLWFVPPLIHVNDILGLAMLNYFYKGVLGAFPANVLMAYLCYTYADQLGREGWLWAAGSLRYPFIAPLILAFVPPKDGSAADLQRRNSVGPAAAKAAGGPFETRFPLLSAYLGSMAPDIGAEARATMEPVKANFEFSAWVDQNGIAALVAGAAAKNLTLWKNPEDPGVRVFGAGMIDAPAVEGVTQWLRQVAPQRKLATSVHPNEGPPKYFEYYPRVD